MMGQESMTDICTRGLDTGFVDLGFVQSRNPRFGAGHHGVAAHFFDGPHANCSGHPRLERPGFRLFGRHAARGVGCRHELFLAGRQSPHD